MSYGTGGHIDQDRLNKLIESSPKVLEAIDLALRAPRELLELDLLDDRRAAPAVDILCPRKHKVISVRVEAEPSDRGTWVGMTATSPAHAGGAACEAVPSQRNACSNSDCPAEVDSGSSECTVGHRQPDSVSADRVRLKCGRCSYDGIHTPLTLLAAYATALQHRQRTARLNQ